MERPPFAVTNLRKQDIILGFTWLEENNPEIDWQTRQVKMSRCPTKCHACRAEVREEQKETRKAEHHIRTCRVGPFPKLPEEEDEQREEVEEDDPGPEGSWDELEEGDRLMYVMTPPELEHVRVAQMTSQKLAEAHYWN